MIPQTRDDLKLFCLRKLGHPVITINVDDDQVEDRIDEAVLKMNTFHLDGTEHSYHSIAITPALISNNTNGSSNGVVLPNTVFQVTRIFTLAGASVTNTTSGFNMFDINYQIRLNELYDYTAGDYTYFELANEHLRILEMLFTGEIPIRWNRYNNTLYIDCDWSVRFSPGTFIIAEVYVTLAADTSFWGDDWLIAYTTALIKKQWGENLKKFQSVTLPGGMVLNGQQIWNEANNECEELLVRLKQRYEMPPEWMVG